MAGIELRLQAFVKLGRFLREFVRFSSGDTERKTESDFQKIEAAIARASVENGWFTRDNIIYALNCWAELLREESLRSWLKNYKMDSAGSHKVAIITAGNIPLVGFHDFLCTLITGNQVIVKCSSNDKVLLPFLVDYLINTEHEFKDNIVFTDGLIQDFDAVIATGSNNTARYFEYYFSKKPHIIRKNRNSVAVLSGNETEAELELLGEDIFRYFGLGCRSVSKIFVPVNYNFDSFFNAIYKYQAVMDQQKYLNNYDYNKAVYLMSKFEILDNGFFILKEDEQYASPIATIFYEYYQSPQSLRERLVADSENIQCVVSRDFAEDEIGFGQTQNPGLADYADGIDTVEFLLRI